MLLEHYYRCIYQNSIFQMFTVKMKLVLPLNAFTNSVMALKFILFYNDRIEFEKLSVVMDLFCGGKMEDFYQGSDIEVAASLITQGAIEDLA